MRQKCQNLERLIFAAKFLESRLSVVKLSSQFVDAISQLFTFRFTGQATDRSSQQKAQSLLCNAHVLLGY